MIKRHRRILSASLVILCVAISPNRISAAWAQQSDAVKGEAVPPSVQKIFDRNKIKIVAADGAHPGRTQQGAHYTFRVELPYDPQSSQTATYYNRLYPAILDALGGSAYTLVDVTDAVRIDVHLDQARNKMSVGISSFK